MMEIPTTLKKLPAMKLIKKYTDDAGESVVLQFEEDEDIWHLYNLVVPGDRVKGTTTRKIAIERAGGVISESERKTFTINLLIEKADYDPASSSIRYSGKNIGESEFVRMGQHHTMSVGVGDTATITKETWDSASKDTLNEALDVSRRASVVVCLIDSGVCNMYMLTSVLMKDLAKVIVHVPKRKALSSGHDKAMQKFFEQAARTVMTHVRFDVASCIVVAGPGFVKDDFMKYLLSKPDMHQHSKMFLVCHASGAFKHCIKELLDNPEVKQRIQATSAASHAACLTQFYMTLKDDPDKACYGPNSVCTAAQMGAISEMMITDKLIRTSAVPDRRKFVSAMDMVKGAGGIVHVVSEQHVTGEQLTQLSGIAALLRYPCPQLEEQPTN
jgi:protein pelota